MTPHSEKRLAQGAPPGDQTVTPPTARQILIVLGVIAITFGACAWYLQSRWIGARAQNVPGAAGRPGAIAAPRVPLPTYAVEADGTMAGKFEAGLFSEFLVACELPPLKNPLPAIERVSCDEFVKSLVALRDTRSADNYGKIGIFFHFLSMLDEARQAYEKAETLAPAEYKWNHYLGLIAFDADPQGSEKQFRKAIAKNPGSAHTHMQLGRLLVQEDRIDEAENHYKEAQQLDSANPFPYSEMGDIQLRRGNLKEAEQLCLQSLQYRANDPRAHSLLVQIYGRMGADDKAAFHEIKAESGVKSGDPTPDPLLMDTRFATKSLSFQEMLAQKLFNEKRWSELVATQSEIVRRDPRVDAKVRLAEALMHRDIPDPSKEPHTGIRGANRELGAAALRVAQEAIAQKPERPECHIVLARIEMRLQNYDEAIRCAEDALARDNTSFEAYAVIAQATGALKRFRDGIAASDRMVELKRRSADGYVWRAKHKFNLHGEIESRDREVTAEVMNFLYEAEADLRTALKLDPDNQRIMGNVKEVEEEIRKHGGTPKP